MTRRRRPLPRAQVAVLLRARLLRGARGVRGAERGAAAAPLAAIFCSCRAGLGAGRRRPGGGGAGRGVRDAGRRGGGLGAGVRPPRTVRPAWRRRVPPGPAILSPGWRLPEAGPPQTKPAGPRGPRPAPPRGPLRPPHPPGSGGGGHSRPSVPQPRRPGATFPAPHSAAGPLARLHPRARRSPPWWPAGGSPHPAGRRGAQGGREPPPPVSSPFALFD